MSELALKTVDPVLLTCELDANQSLRLFYDGVDVTEEGVVVDPQEEAAITVKIADFEHDTTFYRLNVYTIEDDGTMVAWSRNGSGVERADLQPGEQALVLDNVIHAVGCGAPSTASARVRAAFHNVLATRRIPVIIPRKGDKPYPPG